MNKVSRWTVSNGLTQCMGCKGFDKSEHMLYHNKNGNMFPYCTKECKERDE